MRSFIAEIIIFQHVNHIIDILLLIVILVLVRVEFRLAIFLCYAQSQFGLLPISHFDGSDLFIWHVLLSIYSFPLSRNILFMNLLS